MKKLLLLFLLCFGCSQAQITTRVYTVSNAAAFPSLPLPANSIVLLDTGAGGVTLSPGLQYTVSGATFRINNAILQTGYRVIVMTYGFQIATGPSIVLSANSLMFPATSVGESAPAQSVTITNRGSASLVVTGVTVSGANAADFNVSTICTSVAISGTCTVSVVYTPSTTGTENAVATIASNQLSPTVNIALTGIASPPNSGLRVAASPTVAQPGQTVTFTANNPVKTWTLVAGSLGVLTPVDSTHATVTEPLATPTGAQIGGCPAFPGDSILNTRIDTLPVSSLSAMHLAVIQGGGLWSVSIAKGGAGYQVGDVLGLVQTGASGGTTYVTAIGAGGTITGLTYNGQHQYGLGYAVGSSVPSTGGHGTGATFNITAIIRPAGMRAEPSFASTVLYTAPAYHSVKAYYGSATDSFPTMNWPSRSREGGWNDSKADNGDHHMTGVVVNPSQCDFYDTYNDNIDSTKTQTCQDGTAGCNVTSILHYASNGYAIKGGTDAGGLPLYLVLRNSDVKDGLHHAIRATFLTWQNQNSGQTLWPAHGFQNGGTYPPSGIPFGARMRLKASFNTVGYSPYVQNILNGFKQYGIINSDNGTDFAITTDMDVWSDPAVANAVYAATGLLHGGDFEEVDESCLMLSSNSFQVDPSNTCGVVPDNSSYVQVTDTSNNKLTVGVQVAPITVGLPNPQIAAIAFASSYTYDFGQVTTVLGSTNQATTWTLVSGPGSVTTGGVYTIPTNATVTGPTDVVLQASAVANPLSTANQYIKLWPASSDGNFRGLYGQPGSSTANLAQGGYTWWGRPGLRGAGIFAMGVSGSGVASLSGDSEAPVYYTANALYAGDYHLQFLLPNGNYKVRYMTGNVNNGCGAGGLYGTYIATGGRGPLSIGINGQIDSAWDWYGASQANGGCLSAFDYFGPAQVTSGMADIWYGPNKADYSTNTVQISPSLAGVEIIPDSSAPHLAIDTGLESWSPQGTVTTKQRAITPGTTYQFGAVGWYTGNAVTWTASYGTITASGLYLAPRSDGSAHTVTITATSTTNSALVASVTATVPIS